MEIMAILKSFIYLTASSLLVPVLVLLSLLIVWILVYSGSFSALWLHRRRVSHTQDVIGSLQNKSFSGFSDTVQHFCEQVLDLRKEEFTQVAVLNLLRDTEHHLWKSLDYLKMMIRIGPGLGLIGTLIPMGTGLAALGQGDLSRLSGDLVIAFTTTVVGMALGLISYFFFTIQRRWAENDIKNMELAAEILMVEESNNEIS